MTEKYPKVDVKQHDSFCPEKSLEVPELGCYYCEIISDVRTEEFSHRVAATVETAEITYDYAIEDAVKQIKDSCITSPNLCKECSGAIDAVNSLKESEKEMNDSEYFEGYMEDYMCPFCVTPWKCNGPHIEPQDLPNFQSYIQDTRDEALSGGTPHGASDWHNGYKTGFDEGYLT